MKNIATFNEQDYQRDLEPAFRNIFNYVTPFGEMFTPNLVKRAILYPILPQLTLHEFQALAHAGRASGDTHAYMSLLDRVDDPHYGQHWLLSLEREKDYCELGAPNSVLENALYSPSGRWGIRLTLQRFGIVGGSPHFVETLFNHLSAPIEMQTYNFLDAYKADPQYFGNDVGWLSGFLALLYGPKRSLDLLSTKGLLSR